MSFNLARTLKRMRKVAQQQQAQAQQQQAQAATSTASELSGVFTSKKGAPVTETGNTKNARINDEESSGLFGNIRKALFSGGISSGGIFSYGKRQSNGKRQSSGGIIGNLFG